MTDHRLAWFAIGAACSVVVFGWLWHPQFSRFSRRRGGNEITLQEWEAMRTPPPIRLDEGRVQRGNGRGGPTTPKPDIIPRGTRSISYPDPGPDRQSTNPFTGKPVKPQLSSPQIISGDTHD